MLKENELRESPYYYRFAQTDRNGFVTLISVEDRCLTNEFIAYLKRYGYVQRERMKERFTPVFVAKQEG